MHYCEYLSVTTGHYFVPKNDFRYTVYHLLVDMHTKLSSHDSPYHMTLKDISNFLLD
jgi:hypothetical protein